MSNSREHLIRINIPAELLGSEEGSTLIGNIVDDLSRYYNDDSPKLVMVEEGTDPMYDRVTIKVCMRENNSNDAPEDVVIHSEELSQDTIDYITTKGAEALDEALSREASKSRHPSTKQQPERRNKMSNTRKNVTYIFPEISVEKLAQLEDALFGEFTNRDEYKTEFERHFPQGVRKTIGEQE